MKRKFNKNQKCITPWDIQLSSLIFLVFQYKQDEGQEESQGFIKSDKKNLRLKSRDARGDRCVNGGGICWGRSFS